MIASTGATVQTGSSDNGAPTTFGGGAGADVFVCGKSPGLETIEDFQDGLDRIELAHVTRGELVVLGSASTTFLGWDDHGHVRLMAEIIAIEPQQITSADFIFA